MKENQNPKAIYLKDYRPPSYLIDRTSLSFFLEKDATVVKSVLVMRKNPAGENADDGVLKLDGVDLELKAIRIDEKPLANEGYQLDEESLTIFPDYLPDENFKLEIETLIHPENNTALEGLYISKGMYCTQCEAHGFRRITYYLDRPDVMSSFDVYIEAGEKEFPVLLSNGNLEDQGKLDDGRHWVRWKDPHRKPCYLFALVAGDLVYLEDEFVRESGRPVKLQLFVEPHDLDKCDYAMESLKRAMRWDEEVFGREYDLDIYMIVAVNHFNMGAMENKGLNIFNTSCVLASQGTTTDAGFERVESVVAHEYFHNWSGNRVTCRDWFQLSLKEGFTVFRDEEFSSDMASRTVKRIDDVNVLRNFQFKEDAGPMAHPVRPASYIEMNNFYTVTVYNKGAEVVRMLHTLLGPEQFRQACDLYFEKFDGQAVTCDDFVACMEQVSGEDLSQFKNWYSQAGTPELGLSVSYDQQNSSLQLDFSQDCPATPGQTSKEPFVIPVRIALFSSDGEKLGFSYQGENCDEVLLVVKDRQQRFILNDVMVKPLPSLLRNFSAPVKLRYEYSLDEISLLMAFDDDGFNAWDASQRLYLACLMSLVGSHEKGETFSFNGALETALDKLLSSGMEDHALLARMLSLPAKSYLAEQYKVINADAVIAAHTYLENEISKRFYQQFRDLYNSLESSDSYAPSAEQIADRALKNICLRYICLSETEEAVAAATQQFTTADNMTDQSAGLRAVANCHDQRYSASREEMLRDFFIQWQNEALVIDMWFSIQASASHPDLLEEVESLIANPSFDIKNPNRVRSVLAAFAQNYEYFHASDGSGYRFFGGKIRELDEINPQVAARMVGSLIHWKRYQGARAEMMKAELEAIKSKENLSKDVYEIVEKALS